MTHFAQQPSISMMTVVSRVVDAEHCSRCITEFVESIVPYEVDEAEAAAGVAAREADDAAELDEQLDELLADEPPPDSKKRARRPASQPRAPKKTKKNTLRVVDTGIASRERDIVITYRDDCFIDSQSASVSRKRGNFKQNMTFRVGRVKGPSVKVFSNGALQGAGWRSLDDFHECVDLIAGTLFETAVDRSATYTPLVVASAKLAGISPEGVPLVRLQSEFAARGFLTKYNPEASPGLSVTIPCGTAIVYGRGALKVYAKSSALEAEAWEWIRLNVVPRVCTLDNAPLGKDL
jgi:hypothetical protein